MTPDPATANRLLGIARRAVECHIRGQPYAHPTLPPPWDTPRPVFVTLRSTDGHLRGCIGHLRASRASLAAEIAADAVLAATKDKRFECVQASELSGLRYSISILTPAEAVRTLDELDATKYGVIVTHGTKRGVLLPDIPGVDTVEQQIRIARRKAQIEDHQKIGLSRFEVIHVPPHESS